MRIVLGIAVLLLLVVAASCQQAARKAAEGTAERAIETASEGKVSADISGDTMKITDKETGRESVVKTGQGMPEGWPASLPQYPGSTVVSSVAADTPEGEGFQVMLHTSDAPEAVAEFYLEKAEAAGYKKQAEVSRPENVMIMFESADKSFMVNVMPAEDGCDVTLHLGSKN